MKSALITALGGVVTVMIDKLPEIIKLFVDAFRHHP